MLLLDKVVTIAGRPATTLSTKEYVNGVRLTSTQAPVIDHYLSPAPTCFGAATGQSVSEQVDQYASR